MGKIIAFDMITADGYFAGLNGEIDWHNVDAEFNEFAIQQLNQAELLIFGKTTYDLMASYWPSESGMRDDPIVAGKMNSLPKYVFSKSIIPENPWNNSTFYSEIKKEEVLGWKNEYENILLMGSGIITDSLCELNLVDEFRFMVNPVIFGTGKKLFSKKYNLKLISSKQFESGNVLLSYKLKP